MERDMSSDTPRTDAKEFIILDKYGTPKRVVYSAIAKDMERELAAAQKEIEELNRGEFICRKCGLRKDAEFEKGDF